MEKHLFNFAKNKDLILKLSYILLIGTILYIVYLFFTNKTINTFNFYVITFLSHIFFLVIIPLEGLFFVQIKNSSLNPWIFITLLSISATLAYYINYRIGSKIPNKAFKSYLGKEKFSKYKKKYDKYGYYFLFIAASTPFLPGPLFSLISGFFKENIKKTLIISFIGLLIKWIIFYILISNGIHHFHKL